MRVLITGGAGFIGSNLVNTFIEKKEFTEIRVLDNLATGHKKNIEHHFNNPKFTFIEGDIRDLTTCLKACERIDVVSHQAALGSVPRSINDPITTNSVNINGFLNMLVASRDQNVKRFIFAASSSTYGDHKALPKVEENIGKPLSPYAVTKYVNELYADVFQKTYGLEYIGFRYFNVFGPNQDPNGAYAAVIPKFIAKMLAGIKPEIYGDGTQSRDFTYVDNVVKANYNAIFTTNNVALNTIYNTACGERTSLNDLVKNLNDILEVNIQPDFVGERKGDIKDSLASIEKIQSRLNYNNLVYFREGLLKTVAFFKSKV
jgi:UDP-N-acetylglucosamine 4-epimerase